MKPSTSSRPGEPSSLVVKRSRPRSTRTRSSFEVPARSQSSCHRLLPERPCKVGPERVDWRCIGSAPGRRWPLQLNPMSNRRTAPYGQPRPMPFTTAPYSKECRSSRRPPHHCGIPPDRMAVGAGLCCQFQRAVLYATEGSAEPVLLLKSPGLGGSLPLATWRRPQYRRGSGCLTEFRSFYGLPQLRRCCGRHLGADFRVQPGRDLWRAEECPPHPPVDCGHR